jgi:protoporphyrinogen oxidase
VGPHRLFSADPDLFEFFMGVLEARGRAIPRVSAVHMNGRYLAWPLTPRSLARLPPAHLASCLLDLVRPNHRQPAESGTLKDYVIRRYGPTIYRVFWDGYTRKFLGLPCEEIDACWASLSVTRSVIDRKTRPEGLLALLASTLKTSGKGLHFLYPEEGMGQFPELLAARIRSRGQAIRLNAPVTRLVTERNRIRAVEAGGESFPLDELVWTGTLAELCRLLREPEFTLRSLSTLIFNVETDAPVPPNAGQWVYFPDESVAFSRVSFPARFSDRLAPSGRAGLCVEITTPEGSPLWREPAKLVPRVLSDLTRTRLLPAPDRALACHVERVPNTYPIYTVGFQKTLAAARGRLTRFRNLRLVGRQACFLHDNIDEAVASAQAEARALLAGRPSVPDTAPEVALAHA